MCGPMVIVLLIACAVAKPVLVTSDFLKRRNQTWRSFRITIISMGNRVLGYEHLVCFSTASRYL